jgi:hypothetical protein
MNRKAIVTYVDNNDRNIEEFSWLYKSWYINELFREYDIVVYCNPSAKDLLPSHENVLIKEQSAMQDVDPFWQDYKFVNSFAMFRVNEEIDWILSRYDYILKTDADVFLTENLLGLNPEKVMIGHGGYMSNCQTEEVKENLSRIARKLKLNDGGINHVGASLFAPSGLAIRLIRDHYQLTEYILRTEWNQDHSGKWPCWFKGVSSMYAIHLAVNHRLKSQHINMWCLDSLCLNNKIDKSTYHIHAWHVNEDFSKHQWFDGKYEKLIVEEIPNVAKDYCLWIVSNSLEDLLKIK